MSGDVTPKHVGVNDAGFDLKLMTGAGCFIFNLPKTCGRMAVLSYVAAIEGDPGVNFSCIILDSSQLFLRSYAQI